MNLTNGVQIDREFPKRVTRASLLFGFVCFWFLMSLQLPDQAYAYGLGAALGILSFDVFRMAVRVFLRTRQLSDEQPIPLWKKWIVGSLLAIKFPLWGVTIYAAVIDPRLSVLVFVGGIATPQVIMLLKVGSRFLLSGPGSSETESIDEYSVGNKTGEVNVT